jgi:hypothetical protein
VTLEDDDDKSCNVYILVALILTGYIVNMVVLIVRSLKTFNLIPFQAPRLFQYTVSTESLKQRKLTVSIVIFNVVINND